MKNLTKEEFCKYINKIQKHSEEQEEMVQGVAKAIKVDNIGISEFDYDLTQPLIELLARVSSMEFWVSIQDDINYFLYDLPSQGGHIEVEGRNYIIKTPEDLYDYLSTEIEENSELLRKRLDDIFNTNE